MRNIPLLDTILAVLLLVSLVLTAGCTPQQSQPTALPTEPSEPAPIFTSTPEPVSGPRLRIRNVGEHDLKNLTVLFPDSRIPFGDVPAGSTSDYQPAPNGVYNYGAYAFEVNGEVVTQPVIDWVGESPRPGQSFTYVLDFDPAREGMLMVELVEVLADAN